MLCESYTGSGPWGISKMLPLIETPDRLLARFFGIDPAALETEKRAIIKSIAADAGKEGE